MYRVSSHTGSPCERTAQVPFPHSYVFVIRKAVQCALLNLKAQANKALEGKASQDLAQKLGIGSLATERWPGATHAQATCEVRHIGQVLTWALSRHGGTRWLPDDARVALVTTVQKTVCDLALSALTRSTGGRRQSGGAHRALQLWQLNRHAFY